MRVRPGIGCQSTRERWVVVTALVLSLAGCTNEEVTEDRSINYARDGDAAGFQHGAEGVFVASEDGNQLEKIFDASKDTIAVSSPLWSPVDRRLIFTAARPANQDENRLASEVVAWDANPAGRGFRPEDVIYTCLLRSAMGEQGEAGAAVALFEASCDHPGYVAANLAVRWHPRGDRILFVDQTAEAQHSLFEFDLASKQTHRILRQSADALIFDWTLGNSHLVCVLANEQPNAEHDGIWIRGAGEEQWWRVPHSRRLALTDSHALLERLRMTRPAWTRAARFAFVARTDGGSGHTIFVADAVSREVKPLHGTSSRISDLKWHPDGTRLGFVEGSASTALRIIEDGASVSAAIHSGEVRRFAGWNHDGSRLAYVSPETDDDSAANWTLLFPRIPAARDRVYVAEGSGKQPGHLVHCGLRITFPQWSPDKDELSLWGTYAPTHRSWLSLWLPWTLRPGDPAAILECSTGELKWMAVNAHEQAQVGHYYLLRRDYEQAWHWYEKSANGRGPAEPIKLDEIDSFWRQIRIHRNSAFFEYYCLTKLQRPAEATQRLREFRQAMSFDTQHVSGLFAQWDLPGEQLQAELARWAGFVTPLLQNAYITEVYLSLAAAADGVLFFERELNAATSEAERLACALGLSQLLLACDARQAYADLAAETLTPLLMKMNRSVELGQFDGNVSLPQLRRQFEQGVLVLGGGLALLPMMSSKFLEGVTGDQLTVTLARWQELRDQAQDDAERLSIDLVLYATLTRLGNEEQRSQVEQRIMTNPVLDANALLDHPADIDRLIEEIRSFSG